MIVSKYNDFNLSVTSLEYAVKKPLIKTGYILVN